MSRMIRFHQFGEADVLQMEDVPTPKPGPGEILIRSEAIGVSWEDVLWRQNLASEPAVLPAGIGSEVAGIVTEVGEGVGDLEIGARVATFKAHTPNRYPAYGDHVVMPREAVTTYPASNAFTAAEACVHYTPLLSAYFALANLAHLKSGQNVLVTEAGRCIGGAMVQMAKALGAHVVAATKNAEPHDLLLKLGADKVVLTEEQDLSLAVGSFTHTKGVEVVVDGCGGNQMALLGDVAAPCGKLILYGLDGGNGAAFPAWAAFRKHLQFHRFSLNDFTGHAELGIEPNRPAVAAALTEINEMTAKGLLRPIISRKFPFTEFVAAHRYMEAFPFLGRVVLEI
ncbi:zinc-dependent alcohol dehydrogenase family protein [Dongia sp.]|uniref:zinc-dependent alcohol dehydrogenase family protein n=1 Tax=Dongia sp. TaxID=1977262 RepID=UPI0035B1BCFF